VAQRVHEVLPGKRMGNFQPVPDWVKDPRFRKVAKLCPGTKVLNVLWPNQEDIRCSLGTWGPSRMGLTVFTAEPPMGASDEVVNGFAEAIDQGLVA
jgi:hypothetical protein